MNSGNSKSMITIFAGLMLLYQAWRVFDYMSSNLSGVEQATKILVASAFLCFSEIGLIVWLHIGRKNATTETQETVAEILVWVDFIGSMIVGLGDMLKHNVFYQIDLTSIDPILFFAPWVMVVANIAGYILYHMSDAQTELERAERQLLHEENQLEIAIRRSAVAEVQKNRETVASSLAPHHMKNIIDRVNGRTFERFLKKATTISQRQSEFVHNNGSAEDNINGKEIKESDPTRPA